MTQRDLIEQIGGLVQQSNKMNAINGDLYDALERLVKICESNSMLETVFESVATPMDAIAQARAALEKARKL
jgi:hypothetical protein